MTTGAPPLTEIFDLGTLGRGGAELRILATGDELERLARWADIQAVEAFAAVVTLRKQASNSFSLDAELTADLVQECVVTLEPVRSHITRRLHRELHLAAQARRRGEAPVTLSPQAGEDDAPEEIDGLAYDVAAPLLEELILAIDPYPRAPGVEFAAPSEPGEAAAKPQSPFAVLKTLKNQP